ncbi:MAG: hypothetical protein M3209_12180 [Acidobacteriota bacterium]|nr:hypothetical protein [Acidobacteriota bacterium]
MIKVHIWYPYNVPGYDTWDWLNDGAEEVQDVQSLIPIHQFSWGHAGMEFSDVPSFNGGYMHSGYRAFWTAGSDWTQHSLGRVAMALEQDVAAEYGYHPHNTITLAEGLNETAIYEYWNSLANQSLEYYHRGFNSSTAVADAIKSGLPQDRMDAPEYQPFTASDYGAPMGFSNPRYLQKWLEEINAWLRLPQQNFK